MNKQTRTVPLPEERPKNHDILAQPPARPAQPGAPRADATAAPDLPDRRAGDGGIVAPARASRPCRPAGQPEDQDGSGRQQGRELGIEGVSVERPAAELLLGLGEVDEAVVWPGHGGGMAGIAGWQTRWSTGRGGRHGKSWAPGEDVGQPSGNEGMGSISFMREQQGRGAVGKKP